VNNSKVSLLGTNIKKIRNEKNMSISTLSKLSEVSSPTISQIESGARKSLISKNVEKIAKALDVTINDLFSIKDEGEYIISDIYEAIVMCLADDEASIDDVIMTEKEKEQLKFSVEMAINTIRSNRK